MRQHPYEKHRSQHEDVAANPKSPNPTTGVRCNLNGIYPTERLVHGLAAHGCDNAELRRFHVMTLLFSQLLDRMHQLVC